MGKKGFSADTLSKLAKALSVSCDFIMFGENNEITGIDNVVCVLSKFSNIQMGRISDLLKIIYDLSNN